LHGIDEKYIQIMVGKPEGKRLLRRLDVDGRAILDLILGGCGVDSSGSG
jgi:hypothetical protein